MRGCGCAAVRTADSRLLVDHLRSAHFLRAALRARAVPYPAALLPAAPHMAVHLSYCTNIHPGESWAEVRANLERFLVPVRERVPPGRPFGVGLRLSAE